MNGEGLGHVTRVLAIARKVRQQAPDSEILVLSSSENSGILWREGIASVKLPSYQSYERDRNLPVRELVYALTAQTVATFRPDAVVVDSHTAGTFSELLSPVLNVPARIFVFNWMPKFFDVAQYQIGASFFQRIIVPYREDEKDSMALDVDEAAVWVGDILVRSADELLPRDAVRRRLRLAEDDLVLYVGLGGGGRVDNDELLSWVLEVLSGFAEVRVACAMQPLSKDHDLLFETAQVTPVSHYPMAEYFPTFDAAIASAGGHCAEYVQAGIPLILIPPGPGAPEGEFNAKRFTGKGFGETVEPYDSPALKAAVEALLDARHRATIAKRMRAWAGPNGADAAASTILELAAGVAGASAA